MSSDFVTPEAVDEDGVNPGGPILTESDDMTMVFALEESWSFTSSCMLVPSMPMDAMATTPITMPIAASIDRRKFSRTLLTERLKNISPLIIILAILPSTSLRCGGHTLRSSGHGSPG